MHCTPTTRTHSFIHICTHILAHISIGGNMPTWILDSEIRYTKIFQLVQCALDQVVIGSKQLYYFTMSRNHNNPTYSLITLESRYSFPIQFTNHWNRLTSRCFAPSACSQFDTGISSNFLVQKSISNNVWMMSESTEIFHSVSVYCVMPTNERRIHLHHAQPATFEHTRTHCLSISKACFFYAVSAGERWMHIQRATTMLTALDHCKERT